MAWDANGNLSLLWDCKEEFARFHDWDDENRLRMVLDNRRTGYYGYDANGDRVYKLTGRSDMTHLSEELSVATVILDSAVLYPNPFVTITGRDYTKHYYANGERLATSIGAGGFCTMVHEWISLPQTAHEENLLTKWSSIYSNEYPFEYFHEPSPTLTVNADINGNTPEVIQYGCRMRHLRYLEIKYDFDLLYPVMSHACEAQGEESEIFYTHGDHLGSANWITSYNGKPIQYVHYLPYGQLLANQTPYGYDERYKFTGKERDAETGYDYFGARYYWSLFKHWTSPDPLVDDYLHISPYAYCNWNPVKYVDPDGRAGYRFKNGQYIGKQEQEGPNYGVILDDNNQQISTFEFADPINDPKAIEEGKINRLQVVNDDQIANMLAKSGVEDQANKTNKYSFALRESNAGNVNGNGCMDYVIMGIYQGVTISAYNNYLFVTNTDGKRVAHNTYNFGNFLWGAGMAALGIPYPLAKLGAHMNNFFFDTDSKWHLDSKDDQFSIKLGYLWRQGR